MTMSPSAAVDSRPTTAGEGPGRPGQDLVDAASAVLEDIDAGAGVEPRGVMRGCAFGGRVATLWSTFPVVSRFPEASNRESSIVPRSIEPSRSLHTFFRSKPFLKEKAAGVFAVNDTQNKNELGSNYPLFEWGRRVVTKGHGESSSDWVARRD